MHGGRAHLHFNAGHIVIGYIMLFYQMERRLEGALLQGVAGEILGVNVVEAELFA